MHARRLAELAAWIAVEASTPVSTDSEITYAHAQSYWTASKCRLDRWNIALKIFADDLELQTNGHSPWLAIQVVIEEVLLSEVLTRVWSAVLTDHDRTLKTDELSGVAHSVYIGHMEARNRCLKLLLTGTDHCPETILKLDRVRRRLERWTDLLLSNFAHQNNAIRFGHDANRIRDLAKDRRLTSSRGRKKTSQLLVAGLSADLARITSSLPANPDLNADVASGVLAFFPADRFDSHGHFKSTSMLWLESSQNDTEALVKQFLHDDPVEPAAHFNRWASSDRHESR